MILADYGERSQAESGTILGCTAKAVETRVWHAARVIPHAGFSTTSLLLGGLPACLGGLLLAARAVQTAVLAAHMAGRLYLRTEPLPGAMQPDIQGVHRYAESRRSFCW